jgi:hypothetical protein
VVAAVLILGTKVNLTFPIQMDSTLNHSDLTVISGGFRNLQFSKSEVGAQPIITIDLPNNTKFPCMGIANQTIRDLL